MVHSAQYTVHCTQYIVFRLCLEWDPLQSCTLYIKVYTLQLYTLHLYVREIHRHTRTVKFVAINIFLMSQFSVSSTYKISVNYNQVKLGSAVETESTDNLQFVTRYERHSLHTPPPILNRNLHFPPNLRSLHPWPGCIVRSASIKVVSLYYIESGCTRP